jgi:hypothetical protein
VVVAPVAVAPVAAVTTQFFLQLLLLAAAVADLEPLEAMAALVVVGQLRIQLVTLAAQATHLLFLRLKAITAAPVLAAQTLITLLAVVAVQVLLVVQHQTIMVETEARVSLLQSRAQVLLIAVAAAAVQTLAAAAQEEQVAVAAVGMAALMPHPQLQELLTQAAAAVETNETMPVQTAALVLLSSKFLIRILLLSLLVSPARCLQL